MAKKKKKMGGNGGRTSQLKWTYDMRLTLHALDLEPALPWDRRTEVFNIIHTDHIKACGCTEPVSRTVLQAQCRPTEKKKCKDWIKIDSLQQTAEQAARSRSAQDVVQAALKSLSTTINTGAAQSLPILTRRGLASQDGAALLKPRCQDPRNRDSATPTPSREIPLSERTPIAYWDPFTAPRQVGKRSYQAKRSREVPAARPGDVSGDEANDGSPRSKRRRLVISRPSILRRSELNVKCPNTPQPGASTPSQALTSPRTPGRISRKHLPKRPYPRPEDITLGSPPLQLTEREHDRTQEPMIPVTRERAHPPMSALCYRYWPAEPGQLRNRETGFLARRFARCVPMYQPPPRAGEVCWTDIWDHINRNEVPTPFISVSTALWWILRLALKDAQNGISNGMISVIDTTRLDRCAIFYAPPYHAQTKKKFVYRDGAQRYPGTHEHLVWREIPGEAIVKTLKVSDILRFASADPIIAQVLSFDMLPRRGAYEKTLLPELRARNIQLNTAIIAGIARLSNLLGIGPSHMNQLSHVVSDVIQGWAIRLPRLTSPEWAKDATTFEKHVCQSSGSQVSLYSQEIKLGFLDGVRWGCSKHWNTHHSPELIRLMQKQAKLVGVDDPVMILADELAAAKIRLRMLGFRQTRRSRGSLRYREELEIEDGDGPGSDDEGIVYE
ncbi:hypothetical protein DOTSEDRAFT_75563 [Dothistroma septosporum NZE10]|uniref:DUF7587 domain-containing protein n=1 Tax=Dothistroma septosporum (strain NZE10 / CBS 128990) TaxID=675120 RepID=M2XHH3_DOTSN|nr:hypothetical protein DOTSEDRAFT_75563 [Dothistroma septosporum NZE10]